MNTITIILLSIAGVIALLLLIPLFMRKEHYVSRSLTVNVPSQKAYDFLKLLKNQELFNKWAALGKENRKETFKGTDGTVGFIYAWTGDKRAGEGEKEIMKLVEGKRIETEIRFVKPMKVTATVIYETNALADGRTEVKMINTGKINYPMNIFIPMAEKNFPKDMDESLLMLKNVLEK